MTDHVRDIMDLQLRCEALEEQRIQDRGRFMRLCDMVLTDREDIQPASRLAALEDLLQTSLMKPAEPLGPVGCDEDVPKPPAKPCLYPYCGCTSRSVCRIAADSKTAEAMYTGVHQCTDTAEPDENDADFIARAGTDASIWAADFCKHFGSDEGLMLGWFANAIEAGRNAHRKPAEPVEDMKRFCRALIKDRAWENSDE